MYQYDIVYRDAFVVAGGAFLTSVYVGFVVFSVLGYMAHEYGTDVESVATKGKTTSYFSF